jgi:hypothetical protein
VRIRSSSMPNWRTSEFTPNMSLHHQDEMAGKKHSTVNGD